MTTLSSCWLYAEHPTKPVGCLGPEAAAFMTRLLPPGTRVELEYDGAKLDRYGRTLAGVCGRTTW